MWQDDAAGLLREEMRVLLSLVTDAGGLRERLGEALTQGENRPEGIVPLAVCDAISGHYEQALPAAAAMRFFRAAADVFDDIEDADSPVSLAARYGPAVAINAATTLLVLGEKALARLAIRGLAGDVIVRVLDAVNSYHLTACAGQHRDLSTVPGTPLAEDEYLEILAMKSASEVECAYVIGALVAGARPEMVDLFATLGRNHGMAAQIADDIQGTIEGTDIFKRKATLPAIYALTQANGEARSQIQAAFDIRHAGMPDVQRVRQLLFDLGAIHYATLKMGMYRQSASDALSRIDSSGVSTTRLRTMSE